MRSFSDEDIRKIQENLIFWAPYPGYTNFYFKTKEFKLGDNDNIEVFWAWVEENK